jgi:MFS family permease
LISIALPDVQDSFSIAEEDLGKLIAVGRLGALPALLLALVADRIGRRRLLVFTMVGLSAASLATAFAGNAQQYMVFQATARLFTTLEEILAVVFVLELLPAARRGWGVGFLAAMGALGSGLAALLYGAVEYLPGGWRALYGLAGIAVLYVAWLRRRLPESPLFAQQAIDLSRTFWQPLQEIVTQHRRAITALLGIAAAFWFQVSTTLNFMSKFLQSEHGYTPGMVSGMFLAAGAFAIFGNVIAGRLSDRYGRRPVLALALVAHCGAVLAFYNTSGALLPLAWMIAIFCYFAVEVVVNAISGELFPTTCRSTAASLRTITGVIATATGLVIEGQLFNAFGDHGSALSVMALSTLLALPFAIFLLRETANTRLT